MDKDWLISILFVNIFVIFEAGFGPEESPEFYLIVFFCINMYVSCDFLRVKSASESDFALQKLENILFTPFFADLLFSDTWAWGFQC